MNKEKIAPPPDSYSISVIVFSGDSPMSLHAQWIRKVISDNLPAIRTIFLWSKEFSVVNPVVLQAGSF